ncbi:hypothetical protein K458DRAFT_443908 [Lentithecium fluviatile CBS 122367]|uniref:DUF3712 domain-containing protein n=1 Tax=Lentithecium fluviatile CBS 122367 TaxID=1168545 RepID=A0A6G1IWU0_9PLEO|nr:hypothetical protein K458DRAFT_443908 [Lentithecium fluviatile CBS 122367]
MDNKIEEPTRKEVANGSSDGSLQPKKGGVMNTLYPPGPKPGAGGRLKNHCRKFWWCDLLVIAILILVIVLPIIFVAIPKKAQHDLDASTLEVTGQEVTSPSADGIHLKITSKARSSSSFHPTIEGFQAGLQLEGKEPFIYVDVPETKAEAETDIVIDQDVKFASLDAFKEYNKLVMGSESFDVYMNGKTKIHQKGLQAISVDYNKKVTMKGLNKLAGLNITDLEILFGDKKPLADGSNMIGQVQIPNPSVMTLDLGNVTMNLSVNGTDIGTSLLPNLILYPGANNVSMQSTVKQITVIGLVKSTYTNKIIPLDIVGNSSISTQNGDHLTYFEEAIQSNTIRVDLNVGPAMAAIGLD